MMKIRRSHKILTTTITSLMLVAISATPVAAEEPIDYSLYPYCCQNNRAGWSQGRYSTRYNLNNLETIDGRVVSINTDIYGRRVSQGVHLTVNTGKETLDVHLGPSWYLEERDFKIAPEDKIAITGSRITIDGEPAMVARQIKKGKEILILRDEAGLPLWRGWRNFNR